MKKLLVLFVPLFVILFSLNFDYSVQKKVILTGISNEPILPYPSFNYGIDSFPDHLFSDTIFHGFEGRLRSNAADELFEIDDEKATLGRVLFYDKRLSASEEFSCASCHDQKKSFADGTVKSTGGGTLTKRNSLHLNDLVWERPTRFGWDMKHERLIDMISLPLKDENEIDIDIEDVISKFYNTSYYPQLFQAAFGHPLASEDKIAESLTHFIFSMASFNSRHDQQAAVEFEDFTESELSGLGLFGRHCSSCHSQGSGQWLPDHKLNNGIPTDADDLGAGEWDTTFQHMFKNPTLRNIELTAPYMHDGRHATLEDVVKHYSDSIQIVHPEVNSSWWMRLPEGGFDFSAEEQTALVDFMKTFTDSTFMHNEKWSDPFKKSTATNNTIFSSGVALYPNPMSHFSTLEIANENNKEVKVVLYSPSGQVLKREMFSGTSYQMDKDDLTPGVYFISLQLDGGQATKKLIVR